MSSVAVQPSDSSSQMKPAYHAISQLSIMLLASSSFVLSRRLKSCASIQTADQSNLGKASLSLSIIIFALFGLKALLSSNAKWHQWLEMALYVLSWVLAATNLSYVENLKSEACVSVSAVDSQATKNLIVGLQILSWIVVVMGAKKALWYVGDRMSKRSGGRK